MGMLQTVPVTLPDGVAITLRSAQPADAGAVVLAARRMFAQSDTVLTQADEFTMTVDEESAFLATRGQSVTGLFVIAEAGGPGCGEAGGAAERIIGIGGLDPAHRRRAAHNVTLGLMVDIAWQRRGVGGALMWAMMGWARANPAVRRVQLEVVASNTHAVRLYERHGFVTEGRRRGCFQRQPGVFEDDLIMGADVA
ncbi:MAG: GNAT family N-acetyltransferase [Phycisphaerales bacterium]